MASNNVAIGFISDDKIDSEFVTSLLALLAQRGGDFRGRVIHTSGLAGRLDVGRHIVVDAFLSKTDADYLLMLDDDTVFTVKDYDELLRSVKAADELCIVSGLYTRRDGSFCVFDLTEDGYTPVSPEMLLGHKFYAAGAVGLGFSIVPRQVFERIVEAQPGQNLPWFENGAAGPGRLADDTSFCFRASESDIPVYVNTEVRVGHIKSVVMYPRLESQLVVPPEKKLIVPGA
jgi:hypothetical protein